MKRHQEETSETLLPDGKKAFLIGGQSRPEGFTGPRLPPPTVAAPKPPPPAPSAPPAFFHNEKQNKPPASGYTNCPVAKTNDLNLSTPVDDRFRFNFTNKMAPSPHNPPPYNFAQHVYDVVIQPRRQHKYVCYFALLELLLGLVVVSLAVCLAAMVPLRFHSSLYQGCWIGPFYLINAVVGLIAAKKDAKNWFLAHLIFSVLCVVLSIILVTLCVVDWTKAGFEHAQVYCVISKYDHNKISTLYSKMRDADFAGCAKYFKLALTFLTTLMVAGIILGVLNLSSMVMCILRTGSCRKISTAACRR